MYSLSLDCLELGWVGKFILLCNNKEIIFIYMHMLWISFITEKIEMSQCEKMEFRNDWSRRYAVFLIDSFDITLQIYMFNISPLLNMVKKEKK